jgi:hypothetical protein
VCFVCCAIVLELFGGCFLTLLVAYYWLCTANNSFTFPLDTPVAYLTCNSSAPHPTPSFSHPSPQGAHDLAAFMAHPELWQVREHCDNLFRCKLQNDDTGAIQTWVYEKLQQRWGLPALLQLRVSLVELVRQSLFRVTGMQRSATAAPAAAAAGDQGEGASAAVGGVGGPVRPSSPVQAAFAS